LCNARVVNEWGGCISVGEGNNTEGVTLRFRDEGCLRYMRQRKLLICDILGRCRIMLLSLSNWKVSRSSSLLSFVVDCGNEDVGV
jgi:hypothetical protein